METPLFITYYTKGTLYEELVDPFVKSVKRYKLDYKIIEVNDEGSWQKNTLLKPKVILNELQVAKRPLVFLDIDAKILRKPILFDEIKTDFAVCIYAIFCDDVKRKRSTMTPSAIFEVIKNHAEALQFLLRLMKENIVSPNFIEEGYSAWVYMRLAHYFPEIAKDVVFEMKSATLYFRPTQRAFLLLGEWIEENNSHPEIWDQMNLLNAYDRLKELVSVYQLPAQYCLLSEAVSLYKDGVILQGDASRMKKT